jgi:hypothetical protein
VTVSKSDAPAEFEIFSGELLSLQLDLEKGPCEILMHTIFLDSVLNMGSDLCPALCRLDRRG